MQSHSQDKGLQVMRPSQFFRENLPFFAVVLEVSEPQHNASWALNCFVFAEYSPIGLGPITLTPKAFKRHSWYFPNRAQRHSSGWWLSSAFVCTASLIGIKSGYSISLYQILHEWDRQAISCTEHKLSAWMKAVCLTYMWDMCKIWQRENE